MADDPKKKPPKKDGPPDKGKQSAPPSKGPMGPPDGDADDMAGAPPGAGPMPGGGPPAGPAAPMAGLPPDILSMLLGGGGLGGSPMDPSQAMQPGPIGMGPPLMLQPQALTSPPMVGPGMVDPRLAAALMGTAPHPAVTAPGEADVAFTGVPGASSPGLGLDEILNLLALAQSGAGPNF